MPKPAAIKSTQKRLLQELSTTPTSISTNPSIERLNPLSDSDLYTWTSVINGTALTHGYQHGRWLLHLTLQPPTSATPYPFSPPTVVFKTRICAANVDFGTGEICLDLLKDRWTPAYTLAMCVEAVLQMLDEPGVDSPLNVDVARLIRDGDTVAAEGLVRFWCEESRYEGE